jgi:hypothetical protein
MVVLLLVLHGCVMAHLVVGICYDLCWAAVELEVQVTAGSRLLSHSSLQQTTQNNCTQVSTEALRPVLASECMPS